MLLCGSDTPVPTPLNEWKLFSLAHMKVTDCLNSLVYFCHILFLIAWVFSLLIINIFFTVYPILQKWETFKFFKKRTTLSCSSPAVKWPLAHGQPVCTFLSCQAGSEAPCRSGVCWARGSGVVGDLARWQWRFKETLREWADFEYKRNSSAEAAGCLTFDSLGRYRWTMVWSWDWPGHIQPA